ncbi:MAG: lipoprotein [Pseudomonadota bacterium]
MVFGRCLNWFAAIVLLAALAACGRAGDLEPPPGSVTAPSQNQEGQAQEAPVEDKPFVLDGLL